MATVRLVPVAEAKLTRKAREPGKRRARMNEFDALAAQLAEHPGHGLEISDLGEPGTKFVLALRAAFRRAGINAMVRKMRGRDEVRAWDLDTTDAIPSDDAEENSDTAGIVEEEGGHWEEDEASDTFEPPMPMQRSTPVTDVISPSATAKRQAATQTAGNTRGRRRSA